MFVEYIRNIPDHTTNCCTIVDTEFQETIDIPKGEYRTSIMLAKAVIDVYERRELPVVPNLIRAFLWYDKSVNDIAFAVDRNKAENDKYKKYADEVDKYLILL